MAETGVEGPPTFVDLTVSGCPTGASCVFSPTSRITPTNSTSLFVTTPATIPAGSYPLTVTATGGGTTKTTTVTLVVKDHGATPTAAPPTRAIRPGIPSFSTLSASPDEHTTEPPSPPHVLTRLLRATE